jgi:hypothetical protein
MLSWWWINSPDSYEATNLTPIWRIKMYYETDIYGRIQKIPNTTGMMFPVQCCCGEVYDIGSVEVTARYSDCSMWKAPCCGILTDDRIPGWGPQRKYRELY